MHRLLKEYISTSVYEVNNNKRFDGSIYGYWCLEETLV